MDTNCVLDGLYTEVENMLERFPKLRVIFAHFFFMSGDLNRAADFMDRFPEIYFDLTPGSDMYSDFTEQPEQAREFFIKYQDRIIFGTDNVAVNGDQKENVLERWADKVQKMRKFFETTEEFTYWDMKLRGLGLSKEVCRKIYACNFRELIFRKPPNQVNTKAAYTLCEQYIPLAGGNKDSEKVLIELKDIFNKKCRG